MEKTKTEPRAMNEVEAAIYIGMSRNYLRQDRMKNKKRIRVKGPRFARIGRRVLYLRDDLDKWLQDHIIER